MNKVEPVPTSATDTSLRGWQSDVIVDLIKQYGFEYITLNPGASFRGLHDSLINYGCNEPPMLLCQHEKIAVQIAHGYAKAKGRPMAVILHNLVGLLHAPMGIYYAYIDRVPIFIMGATGPMDEGKRRPHIDWTHTALVQGEAVRHFVKWDYQPTSVAGVPESFARAYSVMTTEPQGPIYMCYDAALQEGPLETDVPLPPAHAAATPAPMMPDPRALAAIADRLVTAERPLLLAEFVGRREGGFESLVELADTVGAGVWDINNSLNFPNRAPPLRQPRQGLPQERRSRRRPRRQGLGEADARAQLDEAHPRVARARDERLGRDRLRRGRNLEMVDGLRAHAALLGARARRHGPRHPGADAPVPRAHRRRRHGSRLRSTSAGRPSVSATTKPGPGGRTRRARIGTSRR